MKRQRLRWHLSRAARKRLLLGGAVVAGVFIVLNAALWVIYRERTYPRTQVMQSSIGSVAYGQLSDKVGRLKLLPSQLTLTHGEQHITVNLQDLGISKDVERTVRSADRQRAWLPILNLFKTPELQAPVTVDKTTFAIANDELAKQLRQEAVNARITINGSSVTIDNAKSGYELRRIGLQTAILKALDRGQTTIAAPIDTTTAKVQAKDLQTQKADLEGQLNTTLTYTFEGKSKQTTPADIAAWLVPSAETYVASPEKIRAYITSVGQSFGIRIKDVAGAANSSLQALQKKQPATIVLSRQTAAKTFSYCVAARGVDASQLAGLRSKLSETYGSSRGWSVDGLIEFKEVSSGCNFTVWLSAASQMPGFGAICDAMWSCRVGPNVVINFDRWQNASPAWNQMGGSLSEYRHMVINHETGHWLGFGHDHCNGPGQPAPVMQQQSIDLQGCTFNAWPTAAEVTALRQDLGI